ncbi:transglutaminase-like domain-containing protein [Haloferula sp. BvORR071]|uniref:transglutaminase-like domain-containing protein n=1 Tax=Haloferula sp. BvORR071 TaxID=1396141 RepID=UPI000553C6C9|nr:transglutaminase-like domain-containing protein [Haloferula sp. BvORR071]
MSRLPKLILAAALLLWGVSSGEERVWIGAACALLVYASEWTTLRWDFGEKAALVAWRISVLFLTLAMVLVIMQGARITTMARVFTWLPLVLLPLQFVQSYGTASTMSLGTFSMMVRRRQMHAAKYGLPFREIRFGFDKVYFCATLLAACLGKGADGPWFYPALVILVALAIVANRGFFLAGGLLTGFGLSTGLALSIAAGGGIGGQLGLSALWDRGMAAFGGGKDQGSGLEKRTSLGDMGEIKQSPEIFWRIIPESEEVPPKYLRTASYNRFGNTDPTTWDLALPTNTGNETADFKPTVFTRDPNMAPEDPDAGYYLCPPDLPLEKQSEAISAGLPRFRLRGEMDAKGAFALLPLPENAASLHQFNAATQRNSFGTFRVEEPPSVCDVQVLWDKRFATEHPPWESVRKSAWRPGPYSPDLEIPRIEQEAVANVATEMGLYAGTVEEKIAIMRKFFAENFRYSRYNSVPKFVHRWTDDDASVKEYVRNTERRSTMLSIFLEHARAGHCEFFATAAALLLREAGVPTRYVSGFVVIEKSPKSGEWLVRGTHAHAWCRAWDEANQRWLDVDVTPPNWTSFETPRKQPFQELRERFQMLQEDLLVWRDKPGHMMIVALFLLTPVGIGLAFVGHKLWKSRRRLEVKKQAGSNGATFQATPLQALERAARKALGERPSGMPVASYLSPLAGRLAEPALLGRALSLHHRLRFDPAEEDPGLVAELQALVAEIRRQLAGK